jgi:SET domain-containing protein
MNIKAVTIDKGTASNTRGNMAGNLESNYKHSDRNRSKRHKMMIKANRVLPSVCRSVIITCMKTIPSYNMFAQSNTASTQLVNMLHGSFLEPLHSKAQGHNDMHSGTQHFFCVAFNNRDCLIPESPVTLRLARKTIQSSSFQES